MTDLNPKTSVITSKAKLLNTLIKWQRLWTGLKYFKYID